jgi:ubiquitin carboxyl-terminal hydrolase 34
MMKSFGYVEEQEQNGFNPEQLLSHIIDKIKEYN